MLGATTALLALAALAAPSAAAPQHCDAWYECKYHFESETDLYYWDFSNLCSPTSYTSKQISRQGAEFKFNICGLSDEYCPPWNNNTLLPSYGVAVLNQFGMCVIAGEGAPTFMPRDTKNLPTGGINITHEAAAAQLDDPHRCTDLPDCTTVSRKTTYVMSCDPSVQTLVSDGFFEQSKCNYVIYIRSSYACGRIYDGLDSKAAADKEAAERGAEAGAVIGFMILGAILFVGGWAGIHYYNHKELPFSIPFVGNLARGPAPASCSFGASGTGFGAGAATASYGKVGGTA